MSNSEPSLKNDIRKFITLEGELLEEPKDPTTQFAFVFSFPKGRDPKTGKPIRPVFQVIKPKKQLVQINSRMIFKKEDLDGLKSKNKLIDLKRGLREICLTRDIDYELLDESSPKIKDKKPSCFIMDKLSYPITHFSFWQSIRHLYFTGLLIANLMVDLIQGKPSIDKDFSSTSSLYM
ncbi:MAG TPA: hypothetical protein VMZ91_07635 [Candidatus Paceibacterota bacterium]|nr:hypothetical protein [Candidatus Paceibacterota bacterium]